MELLKVDAGVSVPGEGTLQVAARVFMPEKPRPLALVCLAGGNMNSRYFDLRPEDGDAGYSFAHAMNARGFTVVALDYLGLGDSSKPADGHALTPEVLTRTNVNATLAILASLRERIPDLRSAGVGHSMGAMMTVLLQHESHLHCGLALLGFTTAGLPQYLAPAVKQMSQAQQRATLSDYARKMFPQPYPVIRSSGNGAEVYGSAKAEPRGVAALKAATDRLLPVTAYLSLLPDNVGPEAAAIDVPVYLGVGERDMTGDPQTIPRAFGRSPQVTLEVYPEAGHSHFLFASRTALFDGVARWAERL